MAFTLEREQPNFSGIGISLAVDMKQELRHIPYSAFPTETLR
jgi:hypothetical protein